MAQETATKYNGATIPVMAANTTGRLGEHQYSRKSH